MMDNNGDLIKVKTWDQSTAYLLEFSNVNHQHPWSYMIRSASLRSRIDGFCLTLNSPTTNYDEFESNCALKNDSDALQYLAQSDAKKWKQNSACLNAGQGPGTHLQYHNVYAYQQAQALRR